MPDDKKFKYARLLSFWGPSQGGKDFFAKKVKEKLEERGYKAAYVTRYTTRPLRSTDPKNAFYVKELPETCDIRGNAYGIDFGFSSQEINKMTDDGIFSIIATADLNILAKLFLKLNKDEINPYKEAPIIRNSAYGVLVGSKSYESYLETEKKRNPELSLEANSISAQKRINEYNKFLDKHVIASYFCKNFLNPMQPSNPLDNEKLAKYSNKMVDLITSNIFDYIAMCEKSETECAATKFFNYGKLTAEYMEHTKCRKKILTDILNVQDGSEQAGGTITKKSTSIRKK